MVVVLTYLTNEENSPGKHEHRNFNLQKKKIFTSVF